MSDGDGGRHAPAMCGRGVLRRRREPAGSDGRLWREPSGISSATHRTHHQGAQLQQPNIQSERRRRKNRHSGAVSTTTAMPTLPRSLSPAYLDRIGNVGRPPGKPYVGLLRANTEAAGGLAYVTCHTHKRASRSNIANRRIKQSLNDTNLAKFAFY